MWYIIVAAVLVVLVFAGIAVYALTVSGETADPD
jgi:hypothetical protein